MERMMENDLSKNLEAKLNHRALLRTILSGPALPYALYGGGKCAQEILGFLAANALPLPELIFDQKPSVSDLNGIPLVKPEKDRLGRISTIMLATEVWQDSMKKDIAAVFGEGINVLDLLRVNQTVHKLIKKRLARDGQSAQKLLKDPENLNVINQDTLNIAVRCDGGLGDIININAWLKEFRKLFTCPIRIDAYSHSRAECAAIFGKTGFINNVYSDRLFGKRQDFYDLAIVATWSVLVIKFKKKRASKFDKRLTDFVSKFEAAWQENERYLCNEKLHMLMRLCVYRGIDRWALLGASGLFPFDQNTQPFLPIPDSSLPFLDKHGLNKQPYLVIGSGCNATFNFSRNPVRAWPTEKWRSLVKLLKARYPSLLIVQIGAGQTVKHVPEVDVDLAGITTLDEMKAVLKNASFLVDYDTGSIHVHNALGGKSAVLFGSSFKEFIGYDKNINISADVCPECIWILPDYPGHCALEQDPPKCMNSITPEMVMARIEPVLNGLTKTTLHKLDGCSDNLSALIKKVLTYLNSSGTVRQTAVCGNAFISALPAMVDSGFANVFYTLHPGVLLKKWGSFSNPGLSIEFGAPLSLPANASTFDAVLCQENPAWSMMKIDEVKKEAARILRPDGILLVLEKGQHTVPSLTIFKKEEKLYCSHQTSKMKLPA
jgi:ADP-heptose:LPS heptosyltransferase